MTSVVWTRHTFDNNLEMKHKFTIYLKKSCRYSFDEQFSLKYFLNIAFFIEIVPKRSGDFGSHRHEQAKASVACWADDATVGHPLTNILQAITLYV